MGPNSLTRQQFSREAKLIAPILRFSGRVKAARRAPPEAAKALTRLGNRSPDAINQPAHRTINKRARQHILAMPRDWKGHLAEALLFERQRREFRDLREKEGFQFLDIDGEQMRVTGLVRTLLPADALPPPLAQLVREPHLVTNEMRLQLAMACWEHLRSRHGEPGIWQKFMEFAEHCRIALRGANEGDRLGWSAMMWLSYIDGGVALAREVIAAEVQDLPVWLERIAAANQSLQSLPVEDDPRLEDLPSQVRTMKDMLREMAERTERICQKLARATASP